MLRPQKKNQKSFYKRGNRVPEQGSNLPIQIQSQTYSLWSTTTTLCSAKVWTFEITNDNAEYGDLEEEMNMRTPLDNEESCSFPTSLTPEKKMLK